MLVTEQRAAYTKYVVGWNCLYICTCISCFGTLLCCLLHVSDVQLPSNVTFDWGREHTTTHFSFLFGPGNSHKELHLWRNPPTVSEVRNALITSNHGVTMDRTARRPHRLMKTGSSRPKRCDQYWTEHRVVLVRKTIKEPIWSYSRQEYIFLFSDNSISVVIAVVESP